MILLTRCSAPPTNIPLRRGTLISARLARCGGGDITPLHLAPLLSRKLSGCAQFVFVAVFNFLGSFSYKLSWTRARGRCQWVGFQLLQWPSSPRLSCSRLFIAVVFCGNSSVSTGSLASYNPRCSILFVYSLLDAFALSIVSLFFRIDYDGFTTYFLCTIFIAPKLC